MLIQYLSLNWPIETGWVAYNGLQLIAYFITVLLAAPLAVITGLGMSPALSTRFKRISVDNPVDLDLTQLRALPSHEQITQHFCIQGWSGIAKWGGVSMQTIMDLVVAHYSQVGGGYGGYNQDHEFSVIDNPSSGPEEKTNTVGLPGTYQGENRMEKLSLTALAREQLDLAQNASSGRSAHTVYSGHEHVLRQTLIALVAGQKLDEHQNPGEATVHVLHGRVVLRAGETSWHGSSGDLLIVPDSRHSLEATEAAAVLLTVAKHG